jgi:hypothetical protein
MSYAFTARRQTTATTSSREGVSGDTKRVALRPSDYRFYIATKGTSQRVGLLHDQVTVAVTRPDWPVWS